MDIGNQSRINKHEKSKVWGLIDMKKLPKGRNVIGNKWVFKLKRKGTFRARIVALGYSQIPGLDSSENFSAIVNDITF